MRNKIIADEMEWKEGNVKGFFGKELILLQNGGLKLIKIAALSSYPEHIHPDKTEYAYVLEGTPEFLIDSEIHHGKVNDFYIFPCNTKHAIRNNTITECTILVGSIKI